MVQVEVADEQKVDLVRFDHVHEGQRVHARQACKKTKGQFYKSASDVIYGANQAKLNLSLQI
jgi:hypothetical protein